MAMNIPLTPETEAMIRQRAAEVGKDPATFAREALEENFGSPHGSAAEGRPLSSEQRVAEFLTWVASHRPVGHEVDDSREAIYEGRGE
jgi:hypothetical protein